MSKRRAEGTGPLARESPSAVRASLTRFTVLSGVALAAVGIALVIAGRSAAHDLAIDEARERADRIAHNVAAPRMGQGVRDHDPRALQPFRHAMLLLIQEGSVRHIRIWGADGRVIWSDEAALIGQRFDMPSDVDALFGTEHDLVELSDLDEPENVEQTEGSLLEAYVGAVDGDGEPFVFEAYLPPHRIAQDTTGFVRAFVPIGLLGLLLFQLVALALAFVLARQVDRARQHRSEILDRAMASWHEERRRLAQELHDGVVQELSAAGYALSAVLGQLPPDPSVDRARTAVTKVGEMLQQGLVDLRSLVTDQFPGDVRNADLAEALERLVRRTGETGLTVGLDVVGSGDLGPASSGLVYRLAREGLRNVERHAHAHSVALSVSVHDGVVTVRVEDDGRGRERMEAGEGHVGLRLLGSLMTDVGGQLELRDA